MATIVNTDSLSLGYKLRSVVFSLVNAWSSSKIINVGCRGCYLDARARTGKDQFAY